MTAPLDEKDPDFQEKVRAACNAKDWPDHGCMFPWCVCSQYPEPKQEGLVEVEGQVRSAKRGATP